MTLTIHKLSTHCRSPKAFERAGTLVDNASRGPLISELDAQLGPSLDRLPAVVRLRALRVRVKLNARRLDAAKLAQAWAREFSLALHRALAYPDGDGASAVRRYGTPAEYNAALLQYLLTEGVSPTWQFPELEKWRGQSAAQASHHFMLREPGRIAETLVQLTRNCWLETLLGLWDELRMEGLMQVISETEGADRGLTFMALIELARAAAASGGLHPHWPVASRQQAVRLWSRLSGRFQMRSVWHGLRLLVRLLERPALLTMPGAALLAAPIPFPPWCEVVIQEAAVRQQGAAYGSGGSALTLASALADLRPIVPSAASPGRSGRWVNSQCCGVLLLLSVVRRMDLWRLSREPEFVRFGGPRAFSFLLAATGMTLLGDWEPATPIEPTVALFAGMLSEVDSAGLKQFFAEASPSSISGLLHGANWREILPNLATELSHLLAQRIRGFRQASREAVVSQFIRRPGRVLVEEQRLLVVLEPSPWSVALHISGMDASGENLEWLGSRRVDFVLEGL